MDHTSLRASARSLPEPDLAVCRGAVLDYRGRHAAPADVVLVVEVSQTSQRRDRSKAGLYARSGVPVFWRVDLPTETVVVHTGPGVDGYAELVLYGRADAIALPERPSVALDVDAMLGAVTRDGFSS